jgi:hypothetical protein
MSNYAEKKVQSDCGDVQGVYISSYEVLFVSCLSFYISLLIQSKNTLPNVQLL